MIFLHCTIITLISVSITLNFTWAAPILDGSATVHNQAADYYTKIEPAPANHNGREIAKLETEGFFSSIQSVYEDKQKQAAGFLNLKPIVDNISEDEKYGNDGDKFYGIGRALVNGYEAFANFMNKLLDAPGKATQSISKAVNEKLNNVGAKLVGLA